MPINRQTVGSGILAIAAISCGASSASAALFSNGNAVSGQITIDGDMSDWDESFQVVADAQEAAVPDERDLADIYLANDETHLYGRFTTHGAVDTVASASRRIFFVLDTDNNAATGSSYAGAGSAAMDGVDAWFMMLLGTNSTDADDRLVNADGEGGFTLLSTKPNNATDSLTGQEFSMALSDLKITGSTTIRWFSYQANEGDMAPGDTWNQPATVAMYEVVVPEPASAALIGFGVLGLVTRRRR